MPRYTINREVQGTIRRLIGDDLEAEIYSVEKERS